MRLNEIWPEGHGVDREFWDKQKLWLLSQAAAITLGVDPRVCYQDKGTTDLSFHGGPKLAENSIPGLPNEIENLVIMAINGRLPVLNAHTDEDEDKANWCICPADYWAAVGEEQPVATTHTPIWNPEADGRAVKDQHAKAPLDPENQQRDILACFLHKEGFTLSEISDFLTPGQRKESATVSCWKKSGELILNRLHENKKIK